MNQEKIKLFLEIDNSIFISKKEIDTIEHVDMPYSVFYEKLKKLAE